jgi:DNA-binding NarL/FixJ family response regulator
VVSVVVVDDVMTVRLMLRRFIERDGRLSIVGEATNGREAIEVVTRERPDAVILDQEMPEMTGTQALPELAAIVPRAVIVMYSSDPRPETRELAFEAGADACFGKDPITDMLDAVVELAEVVEA